MFQMIGRMNSCLRLVAVATVTAAIGIALTGCASRDKTLDMSSAQLSKPDKDIIPKETLEDLMKPENKGRLRTILLYHIHAGGAVLSKDITTMNLSTADAGTSLNVAVNGNTIMVNNATVVKPDIVAKNGVIHWIDTVLMPPIN
jgi:hypothetical protein